MDVSRSVIHCECLRNGLRTSYHHFSKAIAIDVEREKFQNRYPIVHPFFAQQYLTDCFIANY
jgi:hypothetical protein